MEEKWLDFRRHEITVIVSSVAENIERVFFTLASTRRGVTERVRDLWERVNTLYSNVN